MTVGNNQHALHEPDHATGKPLPTSQARSTNARENRGRDDQGQGVIRPERFQQEGLGCRELNAGQVSIGQLTSPQLEYREQRQQHHRGPTQLPSREPRVALSPGNRGDHRERGGNDLLSHSAAPDPDKQGEHQVGLAAQPKCALAKRQARHRRKVRGYVFHERRREQRVPRKKHHQAGSEHTRGSAHV